MIEKAIKPLAYTAVVGGTAALGGYASGQMEGNAAVGAVVGGSVGLAALGGGKLLASNADRIAGWGVSKGINAGKFAANKAKDFRNYVTSEVGKEAIQKNIMAGARHVGNVAKGAGSIAGVGATAAIKGGAKAAHIGTSTAKLMFKKTGPNINDFKLTGLGQTAVWGGALAMGVGQALNTFHEARRGVSDGTVTTATPQTPTYSSEMRTAGATGDLNFAMHRNRRG